jgi:hypothetical protein
MANEKRRAWLEKVQDPAGKELLAKLDATLDKNALDASNQNLMYKQDKEMENKNEAVENQTENVVEETATETEDTASEEVVEKSEEETSDDASFVDAIEPLVKSIEVLGATVKELQVKVETLEKSASVRNPLVPNGAQTVLKERLSFMDTFVTEVATDNTLVKSKPAEPEVEGDNTFSSFMSGQ